MATEGRGLLGHLAARWPLLVKLGTSARRILLREGRRHRWMPCRKLCTISSSVRFFGGHDGRFCLRWAWSAFPDADVVAAKKRRAERSPMACIGLRPNTAMAAKVAVREDVLQDGREDVGGPSAWGGTRRRYRLPGGRTRRPHGNGRRSRPSEGLSTSCSMLWSARSRVAVLDAPGADVPADMASAYGHPNGLLTMQEHGRVAGSPLRARHPDACARYDSGPATRRRWDSRHGGARAR